MTRDESEVTAAGKDEKDERVRELFADMQHRSAVIAYLVNVIDQHARIEDFDIRDWRLVAWARELALEVDSDPAIALAKWRKTFGFPAEQEV